MGSRNGPESLLRQELDRLRLDNQQLHSRLRRFDRLPPLLTKLAEVARRELASRSSRLLGRPAPAWQPEAGSFATTFRPYEIRRTRASGPRVRVLHAVGNFYTGGSARLVVDLVERLGPQYEHVTIVRETPARPHFVGCDVHAAPELRSGKARALLERLRPELIHVHFLGHHRNRHGHADWEWYDDLFQAAAEYGRPVIENVNIPVAPYFSDAVRRYVFVSDYVRTLFGRDGERNVTIYPGSNVELFTRRAGSTAANDCLGMVYRLERDKLDETAIDVFVDALRRRPDARAMIVGGGRFLEPYRARVERAGLADAVTFTGYVAYDDLPGLYDRMSIFVAPPHTESFGHVVPLAMSMGIPVVAYAVGALPEILGDDEVLAPAGDVEALAAKVVEVLDDGERRLRIAEANRERATRLFSVGKMVDEYRALYEELLP